MIRNIWEFLRESFKLIVFQTEKFYAARAATVQYANHKVKFEDPQRQVNQKTQKEL